MMATYTRIDTLELKELINQKIGHERAEKYFDQLKRFLSLKITKAEFDKSCIQTIGRENVYLHNRLIRSIIQNASCEARTPPRKARRVEGLNVKVANGYQRNCLQSLYGDAFPQSPRKCRSPVSRDRKFRDRPSPLGPLGKSPSITYEETVTRTHEQQSATELHSLCSRPPIEDGEEVEQRAVRSWSPVTAPLGVSISGVGTRKTGHCGYKDDSCAETCEYRSELPNTISLRSRMKKKLEMEGIEVSLEGAEALNNRLDIFLKRIIQPCLSIASSKCRNPHNLGPQSNKAVISESNGILPERFAATQPTDVTMLDFRVAMESNPRLLGMDWPIQLEKICHYALEK